MNINEGPYGALVQSVLEHCQNNAIRGVFPNVGYENIRQTRQSTDDDDDDVDNELCKVHLSVYQTTTYTTMR